MGPKKIAIVRLSAVGDVVCALPLAASLHRLHPRAEIVWIVQAGAAPLLAAHPAVSRTLLFPRRAKIRAILRFLLRLRGERFDLAVDAQGNLKSALVLAATGAPRRVGPSLRDWREPPGALATNERAAPASGPHPVQRSLALCRHLGDPAPPAEFLLAPAPGERRRAREVLASLPSPAVAISVGGADDVREWTDEGYEALARSLAAEGASPVVLAGPDHAERGRAIAAAAGVPHRAGTDDLRGLLALLAVLAGRDRAALVACDSAPVHLAAAVGLPVVVLSGPQDPARTGPFGAPEAAVTRWEGLTCAPCRKRVCRHAEEPNACMRRIPPGEVAERVLSLWA